MKPFSILIMLIVLWLNSIAQAPLKMSYQAVVRDAGGHLVTNHTVGMRITILEGALPGTSVYQETLTPVTNGNGLVTIEIGGGTGFGAINWGNGLHYIKTETDPAGGTAYSITLTSQLLSVPYAMYAKDVQNNNDADANPLNEIQSLSLSGSTLSISGGNSVNLSGAAGDNWGTQVVVTDATLTGNGTVANSLRISDNGVTSSKIADSSIQSADLADNSVTQVKISGGAVTAEKLVNGAVTTDKINDGAVTGLKIARQGAATGQILKWNGTLWSPSDDETGGVILPYTGSTSFSGEAFSVTNLLSHGISGKTYSNSGLVYGVYGESKSNTGIGVYGKAVAPSGAPSGVYGEATAAGGFGVYGKGGHCGLFGESESSSGYGLYAQATASSGDTYGVYGYSNASTGQGAGVKGVSLSSTGYGIYGKAMASSGISSGVYGETTSTDGYGVYGKGGHFALFGETGSSSGYGLYAQATASVGNTYGVYAYSGSVDGVGVKGVVSTDTGFSGYFTGGKFFVAGNAGIGTESPTANLHVRFNSTINKPHLLLDENEADYARMMFKNSAAPQKNWTISAYNSPDDANSKLNFYYNNGTLAGDIVSIAGNGRVGINIASPAFTLDVNGTAGKPGGGSWSTSSDIRLKELRGNYTKGLDDIAALQPVKFIYRNNNPRGLPSDIEQIGFIAQEVQKVFPEAVSEAADGYLDFNMHAVNVALVNAVRELKARNEQLQNTIDLLNARLLKLEGIFNSASKE